MTIAQSNTRTSGEKSKSVPAPITKTVWWICDPRNPNQNHERCEVKHEYYTPMPGSTCECECHK